MVTDDPNSRLSGQLAELPIGDFLDVIRKVLAARSAENSSRFVSTHYALAVVNSIQLDWSEDRELAVEFVATPIDGQPRLPALSEQGACRACGYEAISEAKRSVCGVCGAIVELT